jgi:hypothetical protein
MNHERMRNGNSSLVIRAIAVGTLLLSVACADAQKDYDDFRDKTTDLRDASANYRPDTGPPPEASIPTEEVTGTYIGLCHIKSLYPTDPTKTLRFNTAVKFVPAASGAGGTLDVVLKPIKAKQASGELNYDIGAISVDSGEYKGSSPVAAGDAAFEIKTDAAGKKLAGDTNTLGAEADITDISIKGYATDIKKGFCAIINAETSFLNLPYGDSNVCLFLPAAPGAQFTPVPDTLAAFKCP